MSAGYASLNYRDVGYAEDDLVKVELALNGRSECDQSCGSLTLAITPTITQQASPWRLWPSSATDTRLSPRAVASP